MAWKELKELMADQEIDVLGLGKELTAHQEIEELGFLKLGLGGMFGGHSGNLVGN